MDSTLFITLGAFVVFVAVATLGIMYSDKLSFTLKNWFNVRSGKHEDKDQTAVENIRNQSTVDVSSVKNRTIKVKDVDNSNVTIRK